MSFSLNYEALSHSMYMKNLHKVYIDDSKIDTLLQNFDVKSPAMVNQY
ncbi:amino-acid racemase [Staphylococcus aureus]|nr:amino-acid racemase [Staphylococcus aureus]